MSQKNMHSHDKNTVVADIKYYEWKHLGESWSNTLSGYEEALLNNLVSVRRTMEALVRKVDLIKKTTMRILEGLSLYFEIYLIFF